MGTSEVEISGASEPAYLVVPDAPVLAGIVYLHWFDEAPNANRTQFLAEAEEMASHGIASILPQLEFPWTNPPSGAEHDLGQIEKELEALESCLGILQGHVDEAPIAVVGHDFGAMHGALLMQRHSVACGVMIAATPRWGDWFLTFWPIEGDRHDYLRSLDPVDPITTIAGAGAPVLFQFAKHDFYIAPMTGMELARAAAEPKQLLSYETDHSMDLEEARLDRAAFLFEHLLGESAQ